MRIPLFDSRFVSNASVVFLNSSIHVWLDSLCSLCIVQTNAVAPNSVLNNSHLQLVHLDERKWYNCLHWYLEKTEGLLK